MYMQNLLAIIVALGCGLIAGVFFAFSTFVMKALHRLPASSGISAMQSINVVVLNAWFLGVFMGTALLCVIAVIVTFIHWQNPFSIYMVAGAAFYVLGCFLVTILFNVPKNEALATVNPEDRHAQRDWDTYVMYWTRWNHVRTVASCVASALFMMAFSL